MKILQAAPGDFVKLHDGIAGVVVINFDLSLFAKGYEPGGWSDEEGGILLDASGEGLVRYTREALDEHAAFYTNVDES